MNPKKIKVKDWIIDFTKQIGSGGFAQIFEGYQKEHSDLKFAVKVQDIQELQKLFEDQEGSYKKFMNTEINILQAFQQHENIVTVKDIQVTKDKIFIIMELCEQSLKDKLKINAFQEKDALQCINQLFNGYGKMKEQKTIHRDLKPENILFKDNIPKIADFGLSRFNILKAQCTVVGTGRYKPPELLINQKYITIDEPEKNLHKIDIWGFGLILFEMIYRNLPWQGFEDDDELLDEIQNGISFPEQPKISSETQQLLKNMLNSTYQDRISFEDCKQQIEKILKM